MSIYIIDGKIVDTKKLALIYADGRWNTRGINFYTTFKQDRFFIEKWSNWQGEESTLVEYNKNNFVDELKLQDHPYRIVAGLGLLGIRLEEIEY